MFSAAKFKALHREIYGADIPRNLKLTSEKGLVDKVSDLQDKTSTLSQLELTIMGQDEHTTTRFSTVFTYPKKVGLVEKLSNAEAELKKLKAIVNELVDYVYAEKGPK